MLCYSEEFKAEYSCCFIRRNFKQSISGYLHVASLSLILFWFITIASFLQLSDRACVSRARCIGLFLL